MPFLESSAIPKTSIARAALTPAGSGSQAARACDGIHGSDKLDRDLSGRLDEQREGPGGHGSTSSVFIGSGRLTSCRPVAWCPMLWILVSNRAGRERFLHREGPLEFRARSPEGRAAENPPRPRRVYESAPS